MTPEQIACKEMLAEWAGGYHHLPTVHEFGTGIAINWCQDLSTYDFDRLTYLVILAHRDAIRIDIASSGPRMVKIIAHKRRHKEDASERPRIWEWHPSLNDLADRIQIMQKSQEADHAND